MKNLKVFIKKFTFFLVVKFSVYLYRLVFVMIVFEIRILSAQEAEMHAHKTI